MRHSLMLFLLVVGCATDAELTASGEQTLRFDRARYGITVAGFYRGGVARLTATGVPPGMAVQFVEGEPGACPGDGTYCLSHGPTRTLTTTWADAFGVAHGVYVVPDHIPDEITLVAYAADDERISDWLSVVVPDEGDADADGHLAIAVGGDDCDDTDPLVLGGC
jgi:hypothetical protein